MFSGDFGTSYKNSKAWCADIMLVRKRKGAGRIKKIRKAESCSAVSVEAAITSR